MPFIAMIPTCYAFIVCDVMVPHLTVMMVVVMNVMIIKTVMVMVMVVINSVAAKGDTQHDASCQSINKYT